MPRRPIYPTIRSGEVESKATRIPKQQPPPFIPCSPLCIGPRAAYDIKTEDPSKFHFLLPSYHNLITKLVSPSSNHKSLQSPPTPSQAPQISPPISDPKPPLSGEMESALSANRAPSSEANVATLSAELKPEIHKGRIYSSHLRIPGYNQCSSPGAVSSIWVLHLGPETRSSSATTSDFDV